MDKKVSANGARNLGHIVIDMLKFKKISKKMKDKLGQDYSFDLKLSEVNEVLSVSMGFRNFNELQKTLISSDEKVSDIYSITVGKNEPIDTRKYVEESHSKIPNNKEASDIEHESKKRVEKLFNSHNLESLMSIMSEDNNGDMWKARAATLISTIMMTLKYMRDNGEVIITVGIIREYLLLDKIIKLGKRKDFPPNIRESLSNYLMSLPGFQPSLAKQSDTVVEQHGYLKMQLVSILALLDKVKKHDVVLFNKNWYLKSEDGFMFTKNILNSDHYDDSWFKMTGSVHCVFDLEKSDKENYYFTDLLTLISRVINTKKIKELQELIRCLSNKYDEAVRLSEHFQSL